MDSSVSPKDEIWFLRVCHHISNAVYELLGQGKILLSAVIQTPDLLAPSLVNIMTELPSIHSH